MQVKTIKEIQSVFPWETVNNVVQIFGIIFVLGTVVTATLTLFIGWKIQEGQKTETRRQNIEREREKQLTNEKIANLTASAEFARSETAKALEQQEKLKTQNNKLLLKIEKERIARLEIEQQLAPRRLTEQQSESLIKSLSKTPGYKVFIACKMLDAESCNFAENLSSMLLEAKWQTFISKTFVGDFPGMSIYPNTENATLPGLSEIYKAFDTVNINYRTNKVPENAIGTFQKDTIYIVIGYKG